MTDTPAPAKPEPVKAWGIINYGGGLMQQAFMSKKDAQIDLLNRWPNGGGKTAIVRVTITPDGE